MDSPLFFFREKYIFLYENQKKIFVIERRIIMKDEVLRLEEEIYKIRTVIGKKLGESRAIEKMASDELAMYQSSLAAIDACVGVLKAESDKLDNIEKILNTILAELLTQQK